MKANSEVIFVNQKEAARLIDVSAVRTPHSLTDIQLVVDMAKRFSFINVHSLPTWTRTVREMLKDSPHIYTGAPVGFPSGGHVTAVKLLEAETLIRDGVQEMDVVMNVGRFLNKEYNYVLDELNRIIALTPKEVLTKVILEINVMHADEVDSACDLVMQTGADFIKTGTGWVSGPLDLPCISRIRERTQGKIKLKVAGGVRTREEFDRMCSMGVERFGINTQSAIDIVRSYEPAE